MAERQPFMPLPASAASTLIAGIGSPFGDDRAGWIAAAQLEAKLLPASVVALRSPAELLDRLDGIHCLHVIDACRSGQAPGMTFRIEWPAPELDAIAFSGTHDMSLTAALRLAEALQQLPPQVVIWAIELSDEFNPVAALSDNDASLNSAIESAITEVNRRICHELTAS